MRAGCLSQRGLCSCSHQRAIRRILPLLRPSLSQEASSQATVECLTASQLPLPWDSFEEAAGYKPMHPTCTISSI